MKKTGMIILCLVAVIAALCACGKVADRVPSDATLQPETTAPPLPETTQVETTALPLPETTQPETTALPPETTQVETTAALPPEKPLTAMDAATVAAFLRGELSFYDDEAGCQATLLSVTEVNDLIGSEADEYTVFDLDGDGAKELLCRYLPNGETLILHIRNGGCTAYSFPFRAMSSLFENGTMDWSNSAFESGIGKIEFTESGIVYRYLVVCCDYDDSDDREDIFLVDGVAVSREECLAAMETYWASSQVEWIPLR